jgi:hypothetical protein
MLWRRCERYEPMGTEACGVGKHCPNAGTNERLLVVWTPPPGRRKEFVYRVRVCNDHLSDVPNEMEFEGFVALGDDAVSTG